ncbi:MAG: hypothetical protein IRZ01_04335 [Thermoflavifilum aggregans]|nr:hypothetical protein [Thermoflavifilum aggregans]
MQHLENAKILCLFKNHSSNLFKMENTVSPQPALHLEEAAVSALKTAAKWAKVLAIASFVFVGLFVLLGIAIIAGSSSINMFYGFGISSVLALYYFVAAIIYFIPSRWLYLFATKARKAIRDMQNDKLTESFLHLKSYFYFFGVFILIVLILIIVGLIGLIIGLSFQG